MTTDITEKLIEYLDTTKDFVLEQAPELFREMLNFGIASNIVACVGYALLMVFLFKCIKSSQIRIHKANEQRDWEKESNNQIAKCFLFLDA